MAQQLWSQDIFSKGEISPLMYSRVSVAPYYNGLKTAQNVITFPQGAAGKRFGTYYWTEVTGITSPSQVYFKSMQYLNECVYLIVILPGVVNIYLEAELIFQITGSPIGENEIPLIDYTILDSTFRVTTGVIAPQDITRSALDPYSITGQVGNTLTVGTPSGLNTFYPARFTNSGGTLPTTSPQVLAQKTYFVRFVTTSSIQIYYTAQDAAANINAFTISSAGTGTNNLVILNNWTIDDTVFINVPVFSFNQNYLNTTVTFTPGAMTGNAVTITCNTSGIFTDNNIGGSFSGNGGLCRILAKPSATTITVTVINPFIDTTAILGINAVLTEPAWSDLRGWPRVCSSFQNRAFFANTDLLPNGLWGSVVNDYDDFNDIEADADFAISWYPTSDDINFIRFIVPYRSLTVHTNSGVFSTPLSVETAITPSNFSMTLQDSTPAESVQPRGIDNQIVILSGNDAHSLLWDGFNNAYQSNIISIANEQLIRDPIDEAAFVDLTRAGSRYMLIVNADGSVAIYQTLISEEVQGFTPAILQQTYGNAYFRWVTTSTDGRGWFFTERQIATQVSNSLITAFTSNSLTASYAFLTTEPTAVQFINSGTLPTSTPQIQTDTWYWVKGINSTDFNVYVTIDNARSNTNPIVFSSSGTSAYVQPWPLTTRFFIEELDFAAKTDFTTVYSGAPATAISGFDIYNAQELKIRADGYGFEDEPIDGIVEFVAHGAPVFVTNAEIGFPINVIMEPLPLSIFVGNTKGSNLLNTKHIRNAAFMFADTVGGEVNGVPIAMQTFNQFPIDTPPVPFNGIFQYGMMQAWDVYTEIGITITHNEPFDIKLIGLFYKVDI